MTTERSQLIEFIRSEVVGPARKSGLPDDDKSIISFDQHGKFVYPDIQGRGRPLFWKQENDDVLQEIVHYERETPVNRYGAGLLYPGGVRVEATDDGGGGQQEDEHENDADGEQDVPGWIEYNDDERDDAGGDGETNTASSGGDEYDFDVASPDIYKPSTLGISFCLVADTGILRIALPQVRRFFWQAEGSDDCAVNGRYEPCTKTIKTRREDGADESKGYDAFRRFSATSGNSVVDVAIGDFRPGQKIARDVPLPEGTPLSLKLEIFPRRMGGQWIVTVVLRNACDLTRTAPLNNNEKIRRTLFQAFFEVSVDGGAAFARYPEGVRPFDQFDEDEQSLALLYRDSATWAIGHGCAAGWDAALGETPAVLYADVMPAVELPSMTPDIKDADGKPVSLSMRELAVLPVYDMQNFAWQSLDNLAGLYEKWIMDEKKKIGALEDRFRNVAGRHLEGCRACLSRIKTGIELLKNDENVRKAFSLANQSMLLQQIATKQLERRELWWNSDRTCVEAKPPKVDNRRNPWQIYEAKEESGVGQWRAFQIAFLLMSLDGLVNEGDSDDRDIVDLIWFPTGGGKTEAYLAVAAFYMFHQRLLQAEEGEDELPRDGTNVFMRYTLRMLTTQQFQRAASLICAMEYLRSHNEQQLGKTTFSLGLWIGGDGSPNKCEDARTELNRFKQGDAHVSGNPLVLTECPWCKSAIGRLEKDPRPAQRGNAKWSLLCVAGIGTISNQPVLKCSDSACHYGRGEFSSLPVEVIDERLYHNPPSMFISTADKFAMMAYKPEAGAFFGRQLPDRNNGEVTQIRRPPGLILQDEFHLIAGPLGTVYGLYEGAIEALCSTADRRGNTVKPKIVASTATIRGAADQVRSVYARDQFQLFPAPGLSMSDSFFGRYATHDDSDLLKSGRLYLGLHAEGYGSFLTTQVRAFTAALFRAWFFADDKKDAWWTLLAFYNSLRELGGARTLFSSDIASRLKNFSFRYGLPKEKGSQRYLNSLEELTSRKSQAELVTMMDRLAVEWNKSGNLDVCLASNIIEVGVDIDRLSLMAVTGQPKSTAQYIQVTGRVGRKWWERPGLILAMYNPGKSRDRSHFEQFQSYHRRLYERVEPTSATPFSVETANRAVAGVLLLWVRQFYATPAPGNTLGYYRDQLEACMRMLENRCEQMNLQPEEEARVKTAIEQIHNELIEKWNKNPQKWQEYPQKQDGEYLMLWPGQYATDTQKKKGVQVLSSMRNVDSSADMRIVDWYV